MKMIQFKYAIISAAFLLGGMTTGCDTLDKEYPTPSFRVSGSSS